MNRRSALSISAITAIGFAFPLNSVTAQSKDQLVGTWTLVDAGNAYGTNPRGSAYFDSNEKSFLDRYDDWFFLEAPATVQRIREACLASAEDLRV